MERDAFERSADPRRERLRDALGGAGQPAISVDTKKKELIGDFKNAGQQWRPKGDPVLVRTKDFKDKQLGKVTPTGSMTSR